MSIPSAVPSSLAEAPMRPDHRTERLRVIYLAGTGHTGSTLLGILLQMHPRIASVGGAAVTLKTRRRGNAAKQVCSCGERIGECPFWRQVFDDVQRQGFELGATRWANDYRIEHPLLRKLLSQPSSNRGVRFLQNWATDFLPLYSARIRSVDRVNIAFIRAVLEARDADVYVDTSKRALRLMRLLKLPQLDVKVVRLVRDVRAYAASLKRRRGQTVADASRSWRETQQVMADISSRLPASQCMLLRYEDLCTDLDATLGKLHAFAGVGPASPIRSIQKGQHHVIGNGMRLEGAIRVRLDERWKQQLTPEEQQQALEIAGDTNRALGYV
jgi:hypothetical protein